MKVLLDTHLIIWLVDSPGRLRAEEWAVIEHPHTEVLVSVISLWEIRMKWDACIRRAVHGRGDIDPVAALAFVEGAGFIVEPLTSEIAVASPTPAIDHHEPFDRILLVHAQHLGARLLTRDDKLKAHPIGLKA